MAKIYSPNQVFAGTVLGGSLAAIYFLTSNFDTLGKSELSKKTLFAGVIIIISLMVLILAIPENAPKQLFQLIHFFNGVLAYLIAKKYQLTAEKISESKEYDSQSFWKVFGMSAIWGLVFIIIAVIFVIITERGI